MTLATLRKNIASLPKDYSVLELGTKRWGKNSTHHEDWIQGWGKWICSDIQEGEDVDVVCDAHDLLSKFTFESFHVVWASSVFEHLARPWEAAIEIHHILKPGGLFFIQTHFTFPIHGYPCDYFRYTEDGLRSLFSWGKDLVTMFEYPCDVASKEVGNFKGFLNVSITGRK